MTDPHPHDPAADQPPEQRHPTAPRRRRTRRRTERSLHASRPAGRRAVVGRARDVRRAAGGARRRGRGRARRAARARGRARAARARRDRGAGAAAGALPTSTCASPSRASRTAGRGVWWALAAALALRAGAARGDAGSWCPRCSPPPRWPRWRSTGGARWGQLGAGLGVVWARLPVGAVARGLGRRARRLAARAPGRPRAARSLAAVLLARLRPAADERRRGVRAAARGRRPDRLEPRRSRSSARCVLALFVALGGGAAATPGCARRTRRRAAGRARSAAVECADRARRARRPLRRVRRAAVRDAVRRQRHVLDTAGLTYAEYARSGFAQLLAVAALTFAVIAAARRWAPARSALLLAALCVLTLVVLASALKRLGLLRGDLRLHAPAASPRTPRCSTSARCSVGSSCSARGSPRGAGGRRPPARCSLFALADPDRRIAEHNLDRYERTGKIDVAYLRRSGRTPRRRCAASCRCRASTTTGSPGSTLRGPPRDERVLTTEQQLQGVAILRVPAGDARRRRRRSVLNGERRAQ